MTTDYPFAQLHEDDVNDIQTMEQKLTGKYGKNIIVIAYEGAGSGDDETPVEHDQQDTEHLSQRGATFGFSDAHGDHHPTLASSTGRPLVDGEGLRFNDGEPVHEDELK